MDTIHKIGRGRVRSGGAGFIQGAADMAKRLVMVGIDGCHQGVLYGLIDRGEVPFFNNLLKNGTRVKHAVTMLPSTTGSCCATLYTGAWYRHHGILNNEWVDRFVTPVRGRSYLESLHEALDSMDRKLFGFPTILLPEKHKGGQINNDLNPAYPTIFEAMTAAGKTSYSFFHYFGKGATRWVRPSRTDMIRFGYAENWQKPLQIYEKQLVTRAINICKKKMPDLLAIYFGCNDGHSHRHGVAAQNEYIRDFIDPELRRLEAALKRFNPEDTFYWTISADHGQTTMLESERDRNMWFTSFYPMLQAAGIQKIDRGLSTKKLDDLEAIISLGNGATVGFYMKNKRAGDWKAEPDFEADLVPVLNNCLKASALAAPFADFKFPGYLDFLLTRRSFNEPYHIYTNKPPFEGVGEMIPIEKYFEKNDGRYVKPLERIHSLDHPKGPDFIIMLEYFDKHFNINEENGFHPGQHGSLCPDDSFVPMIFSGPGIRHDEIEEAFTTNWAPTAASILGVEMPEADGKPLPIFEKNNK
ncbi:MAG: alkaline phosphatase family protein [bacterium]